MIECCLALNATAHNGTHVCLDTLAQQCNWVQNNLISDVGGTMQGYFDKRLKLAVIMHKWCFYSGMELIVLDLKLKGFTLTATQYGKLSCLVYKTPFLQQFI